MVDVLIFEGNEAKSPVEEMLLQARHAALRDNLDKLAAVPEVARIILATNQPQFQAYASLPKVIVELNKIPPREFHFGRHLIDLIERYQVRTVLCMGGAAVPLITVAELQWLCRQVLAQDKRFVTNNVQSADIIAFNPAAVLRQFPAAATDNALALLLRYDAKFEQVLLPITLGTQFDIDTPTDLLVLAASPFGGENLRRVLNRLSLPTEKLQQVKAVLQGQYNDVALIGRIGAPAIERLNKNLKVRLRVFSEERGMKALGRLERNEVVSLLGFWLEEIGPDRFFTYLAKTAAAALIDDRVLFAHHGQEPADADRFYSDLGQYEKVQDPFVREFTRAAQECSIPVVLGGHSLVTGGVQALVEELKGTEQT
ncbi:MAG TPA: hypothetical protein DCE00_02465 [Firmicutes bacterium]|nr:hypothetical protein [Bacillota bacterium]HAA37718.1 hypothetical protein [Bacillota bacterium]